jgi:branched-subunit amino acid aminotransferase/4-amino-4-deoxychorismate lyase
MNAQTITCLNGEFLPAADARVSVTDRGFRFGDGVFETIRHTRGQPYQWQLHLNRLDAGLAALRIAPPDVDWRTVANEMISRNGADDGFLRLAVTRGSGSKGYVPDAGITPTWVMEYLPPSALPTHPCKLWVTSIQRAPLAALPTNHKLAHGISNTLALLDAHENGCDEALMLSSANKLCEAASANLFWIKDNILFTPALSTGCLAGTTRDAILRLSPIPVQEVVAELDTLATAEAVFLSNTRLGIWPVQTLVPEGWEYDAAHSCISELALRLDNDRASA